MAILRERFFLSISLNGKTNIGICLNFKHLQILKVIISNPLNFKTITISQLKKKTAQRPWHLGVNRARMVSLQVYATNTLSQIETPPSEAWTWRKRGTAAGQIIASGRCRSTSNQPCQQYFPHPQQYSRYYWHTSCSKASTSYEPVSIDGSSKRKREEDHQGEGSQGGGGLASNIMTMTVSQGGEELEYLVVPLYTLVIVACTTLVLRRCSRVSLGL